MNSANSIYKNYFHALINGDRRTCSKLARAYLDSENHIKSLYEEVFKKSLYEVGELWQNNKISVASEHMATAITEALLNELYPELISQKRLPRKALIACVENEQHQVGIKMVGDVFEMNGWDTFFLGANTPTKELIRFAKEIRPDVIALSLSIYFNLPVFEKMVQQLTKEFLAVEIIAGGQAFLHGGQEILYKFPEVRYFSNLEAIDQYIKTIK